MPFFPLGVSTDDRIVFNVVTQMWERGVAGGGGCPPVWIETEGATVVITSITASTVIPVTVANIDSNATFEILIDPLQDSPSGTLTINGTVITPQAGQVVPLVNVDFDSSSAVNGDKFLLQATNASGCVDLIAVTVTTV